jgi:hypothetical protein
MGNAALPSTTLVAPRSAAESQSSSYATRWKLLLTVPQHEPLIALALAAPVAAVRRAVPERMATTPFTVDGAYTPRPLRQSCLRISVWLM